MPDSLRLLILDDSNDRLDQFKSTLNTWPEAIALTHWRTAVDFIAQVSSQLSAADLISLDHDLYSDDDRDPGDGLDAARFLAGLAPACPVIVHSSNVDRSLQMVGVLENAGWSVKRVGAVGPNWIEHDWSIVARSLIQLPAL